MERKLYAWDNNGLLIKLVLTLCMYGLFVQGINTLVFFGNGIWLLAIVNLSMLIMYGGIMNSFRQYRKEVVKDNGLEDKE